jgi:subtilisin
VAARGVVEVAGPSAHLKPSTRSVASPDCERRGGQKVWFAQCLVPPISRCGFVERKIRLGSARTTGTAIGRGGARARPYRPRVGVSRAVLCDHRGVVVRSEVAHEAEGESLPAWSLPAEAVEGIAVPFTLPDQVTREWAWGDSTGAGIRLCVLDSGIELDHPLVGSVERSVAVVRGDDGEMSVEDDAAGDLCGHGTACAGIVRSLAPDVELTSVRVLGEGYTGGGEVLLHGLAWAIEQGFDVVNMSLSTSRTKYVERLHELADRAYFRRAVLVASAHNMPVESFPWRFASVISVGSHEEADPLTFFYNPAPPVEFFGRGLDLDVAWLGGGTLRCTGNSFATPHIAAICALILAKHPRLTPFQLKSVLYQTATNAGGC